MKKIAFGMFSLAALVGVATISAKAVRAEGTSLEGAKQGSGVKFGEMGGLDEIGAPVQQTATDHPVAKDEEAMPSPVRLANTVESMLRGIKNLRTHVTTGYGFLGLGATINGNWYTLDYMDALVEANAPLVRLAIESGDLAEAERLVNENFYRAKPNLEDGTMVGSFSQYSVYSQQSVGIVVQSILQLIRSRKPSLSN